MKKIFVFIFAAFTLLTASAAETSRHFMLTGASFGVPENGWFELSCKAFNAEAMNKSVSGEAIYHTANRMATNTFYTKDELERTDVFIIMHVHNQNVADPTWLKTNYSEYTMPTSNYAIAYDYVIKRYKEDCYKLKDDPASQYYGTENGKPAVIVLCTHWHDSRTTYNVAIRQLAQKWQLPLVEWDTNIGFTKNVLVDGKQPSLQYARDTEVINGVTYGWHPLRGQEQYIQKKLSEIFNARMESIVGVIPVSATLTAKSTAILPGENIKINVAFSGLPPWNFSYKVNGETFALTNITENPLKISAPASQDTNYLEPVAVSNSSSVGTVSGNASVAVADKTIYPSFDAYTHQAFKTTSYTTDQFIQVKTTTDNYSREAFFTFNLDNIKASDARIVFRAFFYQCVYPENQNILENHLVQMDANTDSYTTLTWNTMPANMTKTGEVLIAPDDIGSYISWDVTDWVLTQKSADKTKVTFKLKVTNGGAGLLYFYSSESSNNRPQLIVAESSTTATEMKKQNNSFVLFDRTRHQLCLKSDEPIEEVSVHAVDGRCMYSNNHIATNEFRIDASGFPAGVCILKHKSGSSSYFHKFINQ